MNLEEIVFRNVVCKNCGKVHKKWLFKMWIWFSKKVLRMADEDILKVFLDKTK